MSKKGYVPLRMCIGCRGRRKQKELIRFTRNADGSLARGGIKPSEGRGYYLCPDPACMKKAEKRMGIALRSISVLSL